MAHDQEDGKVTAIKKTKYVEKEHVRGDIEGTEPKFLGVGEGIEEEEVVERLDNERSRGGKGFKLEAHLLLFQWFVGFFVIVRDLGLGASLIGLLPRLIISLLMVEFIIIIIYKLLNNKYYLIFFITLYIFFELLCCDEVLRTI